MQISLLSYFGPTRKNILNENFERKSVRIQICMRKTLKNIWQNLS